MHIDFESWNFDPLLLDKIKNWLSFVIQSFLLEQSTNDILQVLLR